MEDLELELLIRLNADSALRGLEKAATDVGDKIEKTLRDSIVRGLKDGVSGGIPVPRPTPSPSRGGRNNEAAETKRLLDYEMQLHKARFAASRVDGTTGLRKQIALQMELNRHAQATAKLDLQPFSPSARAEAERILAMLHKVNVGKIAADFDNLDAKASRSLGNLSSVLTGLIAGLTGAVATAGIGALSSGVTGAFDAIVGSAGGAAKAITSFNGTLNTLKVNTGATAEDMANTEQAVKEAALAFGQMPQPTAEVALSLARAGVEAERMPEYLRNAGQAATATGEDFQLAADTIRQLADVFTAEDLGSLTDIATVAANISPAGFQAINQAVAYGAAAAKNAGVAFKDFAAVVVQANIAGMDGSTAGTSFTALAKDVQENASAFEAFGVEVFDKVTGQQRDMVAIIDESVAALAKLTDAQRAAAIKPLDDQAVRLLRTLGDAALNSKDKVEALQKALAESSGFAASNATAMMNDPSRQFARIQAAVATLQINLGKVMEPAIAGVAQFGNALADELLKNTSLFNEISQASQRLADFLEQNPELVRRLADELGQVASILGSTLLQQTEDLLRYLEANPTAIRDGVDALGEFANGIGACVNFAANLLEMFSGLYNQAAGIADVLGGWEQKIRNALGPAQGLVDLFGAAMNPLGALAEFSMNRAFGGNEGQGGSSGSSPNWQRYLDAMAYLESDNNPNAEGPMTPTGTGKGAFQYMDMTAQEAVAAGGPNPQIGTYDQQRAATWADIQRTNPTAAAAIESGNFTLADQLLNGKWTSLPNGAEGQGTERYQQFERIRRSGLGGGRSSSSLPAEARQQASPNITAAQSAMLPAPLGSVVATGAGGTGSGGRSRSTTPQVPQTVTFDPYVTNPGWGQEYQAPRPGGRLHAGVDFDVSGPNAEARSLLGGVVSLIERSGGPSGVGSYGNFVEIKNAATGIVELVAEMAQVAEGLKVGDTVRPGQVVGRGESESGVIHYELQRNGQTIDPIATLNSLGIDPYKGVINTAQLGATGGDYGAVMDRRDEQERERQQLIEQAQRNQDQQIARDRQTANDRRDAEAAQRRLEIEAAARPFQGTELQPVGDRQLAAFDLRVQSQQQVDEKKAELEDLQRERERLAAGPDANQPGMSEYLKSLDEAIASTQNLIKGIGDRYRAELAGLEETSAAENERLRQGIRAEAQQRRAITLAKTLQLRAQEAVGNVDDSNLAAAVQGRFDRTLITDDYAQQIATLTDEATALKKLLDDGLASGLAQDSPLLSIYGEKLQLLNDEIQGLNEQRDIELRINAAGIDEAIEAFQRMQSSELLQSQTSVFQGRGDTFGANRIQRAAAVEAETERYRTRQNEIIQYAPPEQQRELLAQNDQINSLNLEGIGQQFKTLRETIDGVAIEGFGQFTQSLGKMITDGEITLDNFLGIVDNFASTMINKLLEVGTNSLIGSLFGGSSGVAQGGGSGGGILTDVLGGGSGGGGGLLGSVVGLIAADGYNPYESGVVNYANGRMPDALFESQSAIANYANGNLRLIPDLPEGAIANYANGSLNASIDSAIERERRQSGRRPQLAVINDHEIVLSERQSRRFMQMGLDKVVNHANGNMPPAATTPVNSAGTMQFNIPVNVTVGNRDDGAAIAAGLPSALRAAVEALVDDRIARSGRAKSQLRLRG